MVEMMQDSMELSITGQDPYIMSPNIRVDASRQNQVKVRMKNNTTANIAELYLLTSDDETWDENKKTQFVINANDLAYTEYSIDLSTHPYWHGTIIKFRLDPSLSTSGSSYVDYVYINHSEEMVNLAEGAVASASSTYSGYSSSKINDGDKSVLCGDAYSWANNSTSLPQWVQLDFCFSQRKSAA